MCDFFSAIIDKEKNVYWKHGVDSHSELVKEFKLKEPQLSEPPTNQQIAGTIGWAKVEVVPKERDYLAGPIKKYWHFKVDEPITPIWWNKSYKKPVWKAWNQATKVLYSRFNWREAKKPVHPFKIKAPRLTNEHMDLVKEWDLVRASVRDAVRASVRDAVRASVRALVRASVWSSVGYSVGYSVRDAVWAYIGSLFYGVEKWRVVDYRRKPFNRMKKSDYPFRSAEKLWRMGLVPIKYNNKWSLYGSPKGNGKCQKLWEEK